MDVPVAVHLLYKCLLLLSSCQTVTRVQEITAARLMVRIFMLNIIEVHYQRNLILLVKQWVIGMFPCIVLGVYLYKFCMQMHLNTKMWLQIFTKLALRRTVNAVIILLVCLLFKYESQQLYIATLASRAVSLFRNNKYYRDMVQEVLAKIQCSMTLKYSVSSSGIVTEKCDFKWTIFRNANCTPAAPK